MRDLPLFFIQIQNVLTPGDYEEAIYVYVAVSCEHNNCHPFKKETTIPLTSTFTLNFIFLNSPFPSDSFNISQMKAKSRALVTIFKE